MIKNSRELKAGIAVCVILALFYWGFSFLKGRNIFSGGLNNYYTTYQNVNGLKVSSAVTMNGFTVGKVVDIYFSEDPAKKGQLEVEFSIEEDFDFTKNSIAKVYSAGLMGGKSLAIIPSYEGQQAESGDFLRGEVESDMFSSITNKLLPLESKVSSVIVSVDSVTHHLNEMLDKKTITNLNGSFESVNSILSNLNNTSKVIESLVLSNKKNMDATLNNVEGITKNLEMISDSLAQVKIAEIAKKINETSTNLNNIVANINAGKGTIGKLTKDEDLYHNLEAASKELEELLKDVKEHPKRFVHFSLFGKKAKGFEEELKEN